MTSTLNNNVSESTQTCFKVDRVEYVEFWVGNAKVTSKFYSSGFGFTPVAIKGLETGEKNRSSYVLKSNNATFVFTSSLKQDDEEFNHHLSIHGDAIRDVALSVTNIEKLYEQATSNGARGLEPPHEIRDEWGVVVIAKIAAPYGDVVHTLVDKTNYTGTFLPTYKTVNHTEKNNRTKTSYKISHIDHLALAYDEGHASKALNWYIRCLGFHQFLCNDEDTEEGMKINGMSGGLKTIVGATNEEEKYALKFVFVEALTAKDTRKKNQIAEFLEYNGGRPGVQHIALHSDNIIETVDSMQKNGVEFITVPSSYYEDLFSKEIELRELKENKEKLQELGILVDVSHKKTSGNSNFIMQTFAIPLQDRPTFFFEIITRKGSRGFGERTIKALFEAVERLQEKRQTA